MNLPIPARTAETPFWSKLKTFFAVAALGLAANSALSQEPVRERIPFNADWRFAKDDPAGATRLDYSTIKAWVLPSAQAFINDPGRAQARRPEGNLGAEVAYTRDNFDHGNWRSLTLPHDWGIEGPFKQELPGETGKLPWFGVAWYRKTFDVPASDEGKQTVLEVDGAMAYALVWCNGQFVGGWPYGYASWHVDLTPYLRHGAKNTIAIRLDNPPDSSRWYPGGGIYRNVWLTKTSPVRVAQWGTFVTTPSVTAESAMVNVRVTVQNDSAADAEVKITNRIYALDAEGRIAGQAVAEVAPERSVKALAKRQALHTHVLTVLNPKRWSIKTPARYLVRTTLTQDGKTVDVYDTPFGIRTIAFDPERGFFLNGERVAIQGVCNHHDLGALGAAFNRRAAERQLEILQAMGCNAIRTSHNPPAPELLELCDRMGFVVMDESFDMWRSAKKKNDYHVLFPEWHEADLRAFIRRDRNHPSIIMWSMGNEVREQNEPEGWKVAAHLAAIIHDEDRTRPVITGCNSMEAGFNGFQTTVDVFGYNYPGRGPAERYGRFLTSSPHIPLLGSETSSAVSSRGEYFFPVSDDKLEGRSDFQVSSYDLYCPRWGAPPDLEFKTLEQYPSVMGEFVWTGFDYLGEPTPYNSDATNLLNFTDQAQKERAAKELEAIKKVRVPSRSSYFGIIDLAGFPKDRYYNYQAQWRPDFPMAHILPHWNWPERIGQITPVHVYTSGDEAELFLNGKSLGRKKKEKLTYRLRWDDVVYAPGELRVIAYKNGKRWAESTQATTGAAAKVALRADRAALRADGEDLSFITVAIADSEGRTVPRSKNKLRFELSGPAEIAAVDNGDATSFEPFQATERQAYNGLALVIVRTKPGQTGAITLKAHTEGLQSGTVTVKSE